MRVKLRMVGGKLNSGNILVNGERLQLGTTVYVDKFPVTKDIGILTILENFDEKINEFQICVKNSDNKELGRGEVFRSKVVLKNKGEGIIIYNVNKAYFENKNDFYIIELWNKDKIIDKFSLNCDSDIYNIYENLEEKGTISLL